MLVCNTFYLPSLHSTKVLQNNNIQDYVAWLNDILKICTYLKSSLGGELTPNGFTGCSVPGLVFAPRLIKTVIEVKASGTLHVLKLWLG